MIKKERGIKHIDIVARQVNKYGHEVCGDYFLTSREGKQTYVVLCDGIGSGTKAYVSAVMCANRMMELMKAHFDLKDLGHKIASFMMRARTEKNFPFAAFCAVSFSQDGRFRAVSYENPEPLLAEHTTVSKIAHTYSSDSGEILGMCTGRLESGDTLFLMSDGVTQAGLGNISGLGWGSEGFLRYANDILQQKSSVSNLLDMALENVRELSGGPHKDDATIIALTARPARVVNILTGPPKSRENDAEFIKDFLSNEGKKIICGSSTAELFARVVNKDITAEPVSNSFASPPKYNIEGIDLVTEGAATLNQAYNILDMDTKEYRELNAVTELCMLLKDADMVNFLMGGAKNLGNEGLTFRQLGILPRETIVKLLAEKLRDIGAQVDITNY